ncbi:MAG: RluA family pseudouridine synthase [Chloroflexi bacterium]|nr:RluA family pseudouridine synthase [Chloroflexota bacterium]MCL5275247.1 RluA family pseudouridine synthase [Chloroflexota bacterium]
MSLKHQVSILYQDQAILVISKPADLLSVPEGGSNENTSLAAILAPEYGHLWPVHRLDRDTSGVMVLARDEEAHKILNSLFEGREVTKIYHALVNGHPVWAERTLSAPLVIDADRFHRTVVDYDAGKPAITHFRVLEKFGRGAARFALIEARPETGRTHQIRVHLMTLGSPVAVDQLYGTASPILLSAIKRNYRGETENERPLLSRLGLHAFQLMFRHPRTNEEMQFEAPYPKDFGATLNQLRKHASL